jgi:hypothetical protein
MAERVVLDGDLLRRALRAADWKRAVSICRRIAGRLEKLAHASSRTTGTPRVEDGKADVPLTVLAHEQHIDRRTVERRLEKCGVHIQRWPDGRIALVNRAAAMDALASFRKPRGKG